VIDAQGKDARGNGTASAKVTATLRPDEAGTRVDVTTDLAITGKPAQFGRGVMVDVGHKLIGQFADCVAAQLAGGAPATEPHSTEAASADDSSVVPEIEPIDQVEPIDLMASAGPAALKRLAPAAVLLALLVLVLVRHRRGRD
jgi:hypothetical protein